MRKWGVPSLLLCFCILTGCSAKPSYISQEQISAAFQCKAKITSSSGVWEAVVTHTVGNGFSCEGENISYYWTGGQFYETCAGLESERGSCTLPDTAYALQLKNLVSLLYESQLEPLDGETLKGSCSWGEFIVKADSTTGKILEIRCDGAGFHAVFEDLET